MILRKRIMHGVGGVYSLFMYFSLRFDVLAFELHAALFIRWMFLFLAISSVLQTATESIDYRFGKHFTLFCQLLSRDFLLSPCRLVNLMPIAVGSWNTSMAHSRL
jgi:hypothetical protein